MWLQMQPIKFFENPWNNPHWTQAIQLFQPWQAGKMIWKDMKQHIPVQDLPAAHFVALISLSWTIEETRKTKALQRKSFKLEFFFRRDKKLSQTINRSYDILSKILCHWWTFGRNRLRMTIHLWIFYSHWVDLFKSAKNDTYLVHFSKGLSLGILRCRRLFSAEPEPTYRGVEYAKCVLIEEVVCFMSSAEMCSGPCALFCANFFARIFSPLLSSLLLVRLDLTPSSFSFFADWCTVQPILNAADQIYSPT